MNNFVICCPDYDENSGGSIALHRLCDLINKSGRKSYIYPIDWKHTQTGILKKTRFTLSKILKILFRIKFKINPNFDTPIAGKNEIKDSVVIYPEVVKKNPLNSKKVVRWLLYKIPENHELIRENKNDLFFYFQEAFKPSGSSINIGGKLQVTYLLKDIYKKYNYGQRSGTCYALRKGKDKKIEHDLENSILIDNFSHKDIAKIFNESKIFISYDPYTLYSQYAAICGCTSVVIPNKEQTKYQWQPSPELRLGLAYGFSDIPWAKKTEGMVGPYLTKQEEIKNKVINEFIDKCDLFFK